MAVGGSSPWSRQVLSGSVDPAIKGSPTKWSGLISVVGDPKHTVAAVAALKTDMGNPAVPIAVIEHDLKQLLALANLKGENNHKLMSKLDRAKLQSDILSLCSIKTGGSSGKSLIDMLQGTSVRFTGDEFKEIKKSFLLLKDIVTRNKEKGIVPKKSLAEPKSASASNNTKTWEARNKAANALAGNSNIACERTPANPGGQASRLAPSSIAPDDDSKKAGKLVGELTKGAGRTSETAHLNVLMANLIDKDVTVTTTTPMDVVKGLNHFLDRADLRGKSADPAKQRELLFELERKHAGTGQSIMDLLGDDTFQTKSLFATVITKAINLQETVELRLRFDAGEQGEKKAPAASRPTVSLSRNDSGDRPPVDLPHSIPLITSSPLAVFREEPSHGAVYAEPYETTTAASYATMATRAAISIPITLAFQVGDVKFTGTYHSEDLPAEPAGSSAYERPCSIAVDAENRRVTGTIQDGTKKYTINGRLEGDLGDMIDLQAILSIKLFNAITGAHSGTIPFLEVGAATGTDPTDPPPRSAETLISNLYGANDNSSFYSLQELVGPPTRVGGVGNQKGTGVYYSSPTDGVVLSTETDEDSSLTGGSAIKRFSNASTNTSIDVIPAQDPNTMLVSNPGGVSNNKLDPSSPLDREDKDALQEVKEDTGPIVFQTNAQETKNTGSERKYLSIAIFSKAKDSTTIGRFWFKEGDEQTFEVMKNGKPERLKGIAGVVAFFEAREIYKESLSSTLLSSPPLTFKQQGPRPRA